MATDTPRDADTKPDISKESMLEESGIETLDPAAEKRLLRKIDWLCVPNPFLGDLKLNSHTVASLMPILITSYGLQFLDSMYSFEARSCDAN